MTGSTGRPDGERSGGTPMAERLSAWAGARSAPNAMDVARVLEQVSGQRPEPTTKRSLVAVSHAIERAVLAAPHAEPTIVLALFQRMDYFERERATYERIARTGARVAVGFCDSDHALPDTVAGVAIDPAEALVNEWSVVAVTPDAGAFLVATDQHTIEPGAPSLEAGRRFRSRWGFSRVQATVELARLRLMLGERLPADMVRTIDRLLGETMSAGADPASSAGTPQEVWATSAAFHLAERLTSARTGGARLRSQLTDAHAAAAARHAAGLDPQSGLTTPDFLHRWSDGDGTTVLPVGLALFDLPAVSEAGRHGTDPRAAYHAARRIAAAVTQPLGPVDAAVRLSEREFLVVVPGASELHLARVCDDILEQLTLASDGYPHVPFAGRLATTVTRNRPLPLRELRGALGGVDGDTDPGPRTAGTTAGGDTIVVCATRPADAGTGADTGYGSGPASDGTELTGDPAPTGSAGDDAESGGLGDRNGILVIGHGRFPRSPSPSPSPSPDEDGLAAGRDDHADDSADDRTPAGGTAYGRSTADDVLGVGSGSDASSVSSSASAGAVERTAGLGARHERDDDALSRSWGHPYWDAGETVGSNDSPDPDDPSPSGDVPPEGVDDGSGRAETPSRPSRDDESLPPATAVDEVRNLFGRRS